MTHPLVVNVKSGEPYDVYVGRPSIWGNPFKPWTHGTRDEVCDQYEEWIKTQPKLLARLPELKGKRLACHCAPLRCHAETLARLANEAPAK